MAEMDSLVGFKFSLDLQGTAKGYFKEVSGIGSEHELIEDKLTTDKGIDFIKKLPGRLKWNDVTLKRGITDNMDIWEWRKLAEDGDMSKARKDCSIIMYDRAGKPQARWNFVAAWPSKVTGPEAKSDSNDIGIEEMVLVHEGLERVKP
jgi:phage tail-like protein